MGLFFSDIHIRKNGNISSDSLKDYFIPELQKKGFAVSDEENENTVSLCICCPEESKWISVCTELYDFNTYEEMNRTAGKISADMCTAVLAAACFDSDFLMLDLVSPGSSSDGFLRSGIPAGMKISKRTSLAGFRKYASDFHKLKKAAACDQTFAEQTLLDIAPLIGMTQRQCLLSGDEAEGNDIIRISFSPPESYVKEKPEFRIWHFELMPCQIDRPFCDESVFAVNYGGSSRGIAVMITGDFIEKDELVFENVRFTADRYEKAVDFSKVRDKEGRSMLYWEDRDFRIPPAVPESLPLKKRMDTEFRRIFGIRFRLKGNPRKLLDIRVWFVPLENRQGADCWYVYRYSSTKQAYIAENNSEYPPGSEFYLDPADYDL